MNRSNSIQTVFRQFGTEGEAKILHGGSQPIYQVDGLVFKRIRGTSLENNYSPELSAWISSFTADLPQQGFCIPRPVKTLDGQWITPQGWTAMEHIESRRAQVEDIPACMAALDAFHQALKGVAKHPLMKRNRTAWGKAHRWCLGKRPAKIQPELRPLIDRLYELRQPIDPMEPQLIHGDPGLDNFLIAEGKPPIIIDLSPFWGTPDFSLAIMANFCGPRRGSLEPLAHFRHVRCFDQLLIRAALRMLLVVSALNGLDDWRSEKRAAELVIATVGG